MSTLDKLIKKVFAETSISYDDAERILLALEFNLKISSSHHIFRKKGHLPVVLKKRSQLLSYQIKLLQEALLNHGYKK